MSDMGWREFITLLVGAAALPFVTRAQQPSMPVVRFVNGSPDAPLAGAFRKGLNRRICWRSCHADHPKWYRCGA
jgi:hypothetical protein